MYHTTKTTRPRKLKATDCAKYLALPIFLRWINPMMPTPVSKAINADVKARTIEVSKLL